MTSPFLREHVHAVRCRFVGGELTVDAMCGAEPPARLAVSGTQVTCPACRSGLTARESEPESEKESK